MKRARVKRVPQVVAAAMAVVAEAVAVAVVATAVVAAATVAAAAVVTAAPAAAVVVATAADAAAVAVDNRNSTLTKSAWRKSGAFLFYTRRAQPRFDLRYK